MLRVLLFPFALLFDLITRIRNYAYDRGLKPAVRFDIPVICVGNLAVGGTGKTPMIEHLIRMLRPQHRIATLSRGYGRNTKGFRLASSADNASTLGDEPFQMYLKFGDQVSVAVGEDRAFAIPHIIQAQEEAPTVVLLDDAFQHRRVVPKFSIILTDFTKPFYNDYVLPAGRLREAARGARRADAIVITKCPSDLTEETMIEMEHEVRRYADKPVFFTKIHYGEVVPFAGGIGKSINPDVILVTGIANAQPMKQYVQQQYRLIEHVERPDHYDYNTKDFEELESLLKKHPKASILTTEKDMVKLRSASFSGKNTQLPMFYLPIETEFIKNGEDFDAMIMNAVGRDE
ncbi:tetraacyldisaccharide 4'-kinase [Pseudochryseolinea flava]|uniref:Tetraacyldisaccharide 4'-kinase n=1 Tax=Pseudochryseolinea flava TaxID=2059302 RepID=A0A364Y4S0_9BACT|nr:tetraacyldisaccharide 4'-kinase [Pseudochryseolinea flava]RAW01324.1 tetraacyldisaccharide 4'-kinase [Pseudochryseolinea flava]